MTTATLKTEKRCPDCGEVFAILDEQGNPLPKELRGFDLVRSPRYRGGYRWRSNCRVCHLKERRELLQAKAAARRESRAAAPDREVTLTDRQAAQLAGVSTSTVTRARTAGKLSKPLTPAAVEAWARARRGEA